MNYWCPDEKLIEHIWDFEANSLSNALRIHVATLRKVLGRDPIRTQVGVVHYLDRETP